MNNTERCKRICGDTREQCFVDDEKQIECIADMVINKSFGIQAIIRSSLNEEDREKIVGNLYKALSGIQALIDWVSFLRIAHDLKVMSSMDIYAVPQEERDETRFPVPVVCKKFLAMKVELSGSVIDVAPINFSKHGMQIMSPVYIGEETFLRCTLRTLATSCKEVVFSAVTKYCHEEKDAYSIGINIEDLSDNLIFTFFEEVYNLVVKTLHPDYKR